MNRRTVRLFAAVIAVCDAESVRSILERMAPALREEVQDEVNAFTELADLRLWRKVIDDRVIGRLFEQLDVGEPTVVDIGGYRPARSDETEGTGLGAKSHRSLERIVAAAAQREGAA